MTNDLALDCDTEMAARAATEVMTRRGLSVVRSFDLRSASGAQGHCTCPDHGTAVCTCQYVVLLVYTGSGAPAVLAIHGRDGLAWVQVVQDALNRPDPGLIELIQAALLEAVLELYASQAQRAKRPVEAG